MSSKNKDIVSPGLILLGMTRALRVDTDCESIVIYNDAKEL